MIQGNNAALTNFEQTFQCLKEMVERDEANPCEQNHSDTPEDTDQNEPPTHNNKKNRTTPKTTENISLPPSTGLHNTVDQLQHSLALLELEIVELREQVHALTSRLALNGGSRFSSLPALPLFSLLASLCLVSSIERLFLHGSPN